MDTLVDYLNSIDNLYCVGRNGQHRYNNIDHSMYANVFEAAKPYFLLANAGQIFYFISGSLMVVVLNFTKEKYQLYINIVYLIVFAVVVIPAILMFGLNGIAWMKSGMY